MEMETLRSVGNMFNPDSRWDAWVHFDPESGTYKHRDIESHRDIVAQCVLHQGVPEKVRIQFEIAKNLFLYSWYVYRFVMVAQRQAFTTLEFALKIKFGYINKKKGWGPGLKKMIERAINEGLIKQEGFREGRRRSQEIERRKEENRIFYEQTGYALWAVPNEEHFLQITILEGIPTIRNWLSHGTSMLYPGVDMHIELCCDFINQLYKRMNTSGIIDKSSNPFSCASWIKQASGFTKHRQKQAEAILGESTDDICRLGRNSARFPAFVAIRWGFAEIKEGVFVPTEKWTNRLNYDLYGEKL